ncbi:restriction endonuclease [Shewanella scandinavica]|uniref:Restriction endonuclease n=1 Tax=Shewanella scandinavica TaxID=3063538 RepID=A0ABU3FZU4_9GAMM|nr:restriction endonuclease [Shewanella sp. SP2S1-2]MDT3280895.1 restriction endonuclease [Shewanella sp. SP2S1-2]
MNTITTAQQKVRNISQLGLSIYDDIKIGDIHLWLTSDELSLLLNQRLVGASLAGLPIKTRSKTAKEMVCRALGYVLPTSFIKCQPRFSGQMFDTYVQKSNNLQVWNEELEVERRYVIIRIDENDVITKVRVISGSDLAVLDTTGTLTQKFQARLTPSHKVLELISPYDTDNIRNLLASSPIVLSQCNPTSQPQIGQLLPIAECFIRLQQLVGCTFPDAGIIQERNRGATLHAMVCNALGYSDYRDNGQFPDIKHQLLEVKLQTSQTIDLGLFCPNSEAILDIEQIGTQQVRHCDVRYALFYGHITNGVVHITNLYLTTGESFFTRFEQFGGKVLNKKIQITLPHSFFN